VQAEHTERAKVEQSTVQLAQGVGQLAQNSGELTKEIRDNRPISANVLFNDFLANQVETTFTADRKGLFGRIHRSKTTPTVFTTDGKQVYALSHVSDTVFSLRRGRRRLGVGRCRLRPPVRLQHGRLRQMEFLAIDPRVVVVPVDASRSSALGVKVYPSPPTRSSSPRPS
jgi:hypothetical protein